MSESIKHTFVETEEYKNIVEKFGEPSSISIDRANEMLAKLEEEFNQAIYESADLYSNQRGLDAQYLDNICNTLVRLNDWGFFFSQVPELNIEIIDELLSFVDNIFNCMEIADLTKLSITIDPENEKEEFNILDQALKHLDNIIGTLDAQKTLCSFSNTFLKNASRISDKAKTFKDAIVTFKQSPERNDSDTSRSDLFQKDVLLLKSLKAFNRLSDSEKEVRLKDTWGEIEFYRNEISTQVFNNTEPIDAGTIDLINNFFLSVLDHLFYLRDTEHFNRIKENLEFVDKIVDAKDKYFKIDSAIMVDERQQKFILKSVYDDICKSTEMLGVISNIFLDFPNTAEKIESFLEYYLGLERDLNALIANGEVNIYDKQKHFEEALKKAMEIAYNRASGTLEDAEGEITDIQKLLGDILNVDPSDLPMPNLENKDKD